MRFKTVFVSVTSVYASSCFMSGVWRCVCVYLSWASGRYGWKIIKKKREQFSGCLTVLGPLVWRRRDPIMKTDNSCLTRLLNRAVAEERTIKKYWKQGHETPLDMLKFHILTLVRKKMRNRIDLFLFYNFDELSLHQSTDKVLWVSFKLSVQSFYRAKLT